MKCEICKKNEAEVAYLPEGADDEDELYVCKACAKAERVKRQKKSQRTRKVIEISEVDASEAPPIVGAIMNAFGDMISEIEKVTSSEEAAKEPQPEAERKLQDFPVERAPAQFRIGRRLHLEGLHLIGELEAVMRSMRALDMELVGVAADGVRDAGHVYEVKYLNSSERAKRVVSDLLREERNARVRLFEEMPRVFGDSLCRALAIMKNCRLLSPGELFDLLSPLRLAAKEEALDGITLKEIETMLSKVDLSGGEDDLSQEERDRADAERADRMNARFEDVVLNERAEEKFL